jgi:hypothetical protein
VTIEEMRAALERVSAALGGLDIDDLEEVACLASELRQQAWTVRATKVAAEVRAERTAGS